MTTLFRGRGTGLVVAVCAAAVLTGAPVASAASNWSPPLDPGSAAQAQSVPITAPTNVTASCTAPLTQKTVTVTWSGVSHAKYNLLQATSPTGAYSTVATNISTLSWTSGALSYGSTYYYKVVAFISGTWQSGPSVATAGRTIQKTSPYCS